MADDPMNPLRFGAEDYLSHGNSAVAFVPSVVFKAPIFSDRQPSLEREREVYNRLKPGHDGLVTFYGTLLCYNILGLAKHGSIREVYHNGMKFDLTTKLRWIKEIATTFVYIHSRKVLHGDISCHNIFLDEKWRTKVGDFAGSCIDDQASLVAYETSYSILGEDDITLKTELFALGSTFYEILHGQKPFASLMAHEVEAKFSKGVFPELESLPACQTIIDKCWQQQYNTVDELLVDITNEEHSTHGCFQDKSYSSTFVEPLRARAWSLIGLTGIGATVIGILLYVRFRRCAL